MSTAVDRAFEPAALPPEIAGWAEAFASVMMDADELLHLAAALAAYDWSDGAIVVEIGAYLGQTTVFMAKVLEHVGSPAPILSIDAFERVVPDPLNPQGVFETYLQNVAAAGFAARCFPLVGFSQQVAPVVPNAIGVLVLDGGHYDEVVRADLALYAPKIRPGGYLFADDYGPMYPEVVRALDDFLARTPEFTVVARRGFVIARRAQEGAAWAS